MIDIELWCDCGARLDYEVSYNQSSVEITTKECDSCKDTAYDTGYQDAENTYGNVN